MGIATQVAANTRREALAKVWCQWHGQKGTDKQAARVRGDEETLARCLSERGIIVTQASTSSWRVERVA